MHYVLDEDGDYHLMDGDAEIELSKEPIKELAIAYSAPADPDSLWTMHRHGTIEQVRYWLTVNKAQFLSVGMVDLANELHMIKGRINPEMINHAIDCTGFIKKLVAYHIEAENTIDVPSREILSTAAAPRNR